MDRAKVSRPADSVKVGRSAPKWIRTTGLILRRDALYPAELWAQFGKRISRVLSPKHHPMMVPVKADHLSRTSIARRLQQPTRDFRRYAYMARAAPRPLFGLAPSGVYRAAAVASGRGGLLHHRFTLACAPPENWRAIGGLFSVALSIALRRPAVSRHSALWSSDFPRVV
jgi:hypothetical protein